MLRTAPLLLVLFACGLIADGQSRPCQPPALQAPPRGSNIFTEEQESDLGDAIAEHLQRDFRVIDDEELTVHLNRVGQRIVGKLPESNLRIQFFLVDIPDANAFVLPGGRVYVSRKLVAFCQSEDELAGVIAHELGHLLARQGATGVTRLLRVVLGVTAVKDRRDIFDKYNQLVENVARKPGAFKDEGNREDEQLVADQIGLFAVVAAGYEAQAFARFFDRLTENKGKTGNFFSELFGATKPESKRFREMSRSTATLPASCIEARSAAPADQFKKWQSAVVTYTGLGRRESLHGVLKKVALEPPLRSEVSYMRFSPNGKYVVAQDDSGINVLSVEPFAPLFRIEASDANPAEFSPDSQEIVFSNSSLRVEVWNVAEQKMKEAHELFIRQGCLQSLISPDGKTLACIDEDSSLILVDVATGNQTLLKKDLPLPGVYELVFRGLNELLAGEEGSGEFKLANMSFSPDGRIFVAGARGIQYGLTGSRGIQASVAVDVATRQQIPLKGALKGMLSKRFTFLSPDRVVCADEKDSNQSVVLSFPGGEVIDKFVTGRGEVSRPGGGKYAIVRPISGYAVGVVDLSTRKIFMANKLSAFDIFETVFVSERSDGALGLYNVVGGELKSLVVLPRNPLGNLRVCALSPDLKWLAISERSRGGIWNLSKGERSYLVRGFRGGHFGEDGAFYADFPRFEKVNRAVGRLELGKRDVANPYDINDATTIQYGRFLVSVRQVGKGKDGETPELLNFSEALSNLIRNTAYTAKNVRLEIRDVQDNALLWSRVFPKEAPRVWMNLHYPFMVFSWAISESAAQDEIKRDPALTRQRAAMKEPEGDYFLQVLDPRTGNVGGRLLIETGKGSLRIRQVFAAGDWVVVSDSQNRTLVYSLASGEQKGRVFGSKPAISAAAGLLCVENEPGQVTVYKLASMEKQNQFGFSSPVQLAKFSEDGKTLVILTANQTAYVLDMTASAPAQPR
jgi:hypothetical protein